MHRYILVGALLLFGAGCESLDPAPDLAIARGLIENRLGHEVAWSGSVEIPAGSDRLTLDRATRLALARHPVIRSGMAQVAESRADLVQAGLLPNPVIQAGYGFPLDGRGGGPVMATIVQSLAALWLRPARVEAAEADLRVRILELSDVALRLVADVRMRFAEVVHGRRRLQLDRQLNETRREQLDLATELFEVGELDRRRTNAARLAWSQARDRVVRSAEALAGAERRLAERIGDWSPRASSIEDSLNEPKPVPSEERVLELVADQRLDVAAAYVALDGSHARHRLARLQRIPHLGAGVGYEQNFGRRDALFPRLELEVPIFDTGRAAVAKAQAIETRTVAEADRLLLQACLEARLAHVALSAARERLEGLESDWLPAARENVEIARDLFATGELTRATVLEEEARLLTVERERNEILLTTHLAYFELERAVGGRVSE